MLKKFLDFYKLGGDYASLIDSIQNNKKCSICGMGQSEKAISSLNATGKVLYIASDFSIAKNSYQLFNCLLPNSTCLLPPAQDNLTYKSVQSAENNIDRIRTIFSLCTNKCDVVCTSAEALFCYLPNINEFKKHIHIIKKGENVDYSEFRTSLVEMGYTEEALVSEPGQFSIRGDIIDVFPINTKIPYRIELFDIEVVSIKQFDIESQNTIKEVKYCEICPYTDLFIDNEQISEISKNLEKLKKNTFESREAEERFNSIATEIVERLNLKDRAFALDYIFPLMTDSLSTIFDYINDDFVVVIDESKMVYDALLKVESEYIERKNDLAKSGEVLNCKELGILNLECLLQKLRGTNLVVHQKITNANRFFSPEKVFNFRTSAVSKYVGNTTELINDINSWILDDYNIFLCAGDERGARALARTLKANKIDFEIDRYPTIDKTASAILPFDFPSGFCLPDRKLVVLGTNELLAKKQKNEHISVNRKDVFSVPKIGDYVVHAIHGIGICEGITKLSGKLGTKDYIVVGYRDGDKLYVPIDQMDLLDRFSGGETPSRLSKIGGTEFGAVKERVRKNIKKMAFDLLQLYAERESRKGFAFVKDDEMQLDFEDSFPYAETEDQLKAIEEVKKDMESNKVMDRLVCGDVGFGKTEVALRAIFKAVLSGKQVAFLAPTTILSEQHYNTCMSRFDGFGINVAVLNRFKSTKEINEILRKLESGEINVVCGTHRLLSKDVKYYNLGLLVLDEEQKFGVEDKEKLKLKKSNVDVLTLSATPIPRTLHMSLSGIRDVSIIATPPKERQPIQTFVCEYSDTLIKDAINKELKRGGQAFIVYNRVETIYQFAQKIKTLIPNAKIVVGHGQLSSHELEDVIYKFYNQEADILIATTIIENGVDMSNANTLVVMNSDMFGLSQLYQIRGRVGRGNRQGYAYFTYNGKKSLSDDGYKRLSAISEFTEFGSGFKIAMRDLEIRGGGNVLGAEQHGHVQKIGYELYCKMLNEAISELKGNAIVEDKDVLIKIGVDAFIPESYIESTSNRMTIYKNISRIESLEERDKLVREVEDVFGKMPKCAENLFDIAYIKALAKRIGVVEIYCTDVEIKLVFDAKDNKVMSKPMSLALNKYSAVCVLNFSKVPTITFKYTGNDSAGNFNLLKDFLIISSENGKK